MPTVRLTCRCGHTWEQSLAGPPPADPSSLCPVCTARSLETVSRCDPPPAPPASPDGPAVGTVLAGFEILGEINRGGMGVIYKARQRGLNRLVALKVIAPGRVGNADALRRFKREVQAAALLSHPNIVTVYHTDLDGPWPYLAMEYVDGIDLHRLVREAGPLPVADALRYVRQAANGLQHAFEQGLVHRDIKPANLMVSPDPRKPPPGPARPPRVKILDMGLARVAPDAAPLPADPMTQAGEFLGTPDFIAPEQAQDSRRADIRSDLYSLGGTLYFLLTGEVPFPGGNVVQKICRQATEPPPPPLARRPEVGRRVDALVRRLMALDPADRPQTPADLINEIERLQKGRPVRSSTPAAPPPAPPVVVPPPSTPTPPPATPTTTAVGSGVVGPPSSSTLTAAVVRAHTGGAQAVASDVGVLVSGGLDGAIRVWNPDRMREVRAITRGVGALEHLALAPGGKVAVSCSLGLTPDEMGVQVWDLATGRAVRRLGGPTANLRCVAVSPDGSWVAAGAADGSVWVWGLVGPAAPPVHQLRGHDGPVTAVQFLSVGESLLTAGRDGTVRQWDLRTGRAKGVVAAPVGPLAGMAFAGPRKKRLAVAGQTLAVRHRDGAFERFDGHDGPVTCVAFSADGELVFSGGEDRTVRAWRAEDGTPVAVWTGHTGRVQAVAGPDGRMAFSASMDGTVRRWVVPPPTAQG